MNRFQFIDDHSQRYGAKRLCRVLGIARSSFYHWKATAAARQADDAALAARIRGRARRLRRHLRRAADHRRATRGRRTGQPQFLYLATVPDLHSRRPAGPSPTTCAPTSCWTPRTPRSTPEAAWPARSPHTDHGAQYTSRAFADACEQAGARQSMSPIGSNADNAAAESFNATLKRETPQGRRAFTDEHDARLTTLRWLHRYNTIRRHSHLGQQAPNTYEKTLRPTSTTLTSAA